MPCYVLRIDADGWGELLFFEGRNLAALPVPDCWPDGGPARARWGTRCRGSGMCALMLCKHAGCPDDLLVEVARVSLGEFVAQLPKSEQTLPSWRVAQGMTRIAVRVMTDLNGN